MRERERECVCVCVRARAGATPENEECYSKKSARQSTLWNWVSSKVHGIGSSRFAIAIFPGTYDLEVLQTCLK